MSGGSRSRYTPEQVARALHEANGCRAAAVRALGCARSTLDTYIQRYPSVRAAAGDPRVAVPRYTPAQVAAALEEYGSARRAAAALGCSPSTLGDYAERYQEVRRVYDRVVPRRGRYTDEQIAEAVRRARGNLAQAARSLGCWPGTITHYFRCHPELRAEIDRDRAEQPYVRPGAGPDDPLYSEQEVADAIRKARGVVSGAARILGCERRRVLALMARFPLAAQAYKESRAARCGAATSKWVEAVEAGQWQAVHRVLSRFGQELGYRPVTKRRKRAKTKRRKRAKR